MLKTTVMVNFQNSPSIKTGRDHHSRRCSPVYEPVYFAFSDVMDQHLINFFVKFETLLCSGNYHTIIIIAPHNVVANLFNDLFFSSLIADSNLPPVHSPNRTLVVCDPVSTLPVSYASAPHLHNSSSANLCCLLAIAPN